MNREVAHVTEAAFTVRQLIEELEGLDQDARVLFTCSYGDYHNTQQALPVGEVVADLATSDLAESGYSQSGIQLVEDRHEPDEDVEDDDEEFPVVIIRS